MIAYSLQFPTPQTWVSTVLNDFDSFLIDHAAAEKKASGMAISMISHYPDRTALVEAMSDLALEELVHFRDVVKVMHKRGLQLAPDTKDPYINSLRGHMRRGTDVFFLDRLLIGSIVEARGAERFGLIADALEDGELKNFYIAITESEKRHDDLFMRFACLYFDHTTVEARLKELLTIEADIVANLPIVAALH